MEEFVNGLITILGMAGAVLFWVVVMVTIVFLLEMFGVGRKPE